MQRLPRILIASAASGSGKTTLTCALLRALMNRGCVPAAFKCGPDYIDPMFHTEVLGAASSNLDLFLTGEQTVQRLLCQNAAGAGIAVMEGVMGYYDGMGSGEQYSAYHLARATQTPVILVQNCKGMSCTAAALVHGLKSFRTDSNIQGVILNNTSESMYGLYREMIERETGVAVLGYLPHLPDCRFESRHLGLVTAAETEDLQARLQTLAETAEKTIDLERLLAIAGAAPDLQAPELQIDEKFNVKVAVAKDAAFCFYYKDALDLLTLMGAELIPFSPLENHTVPDCDGMILGGGYPELYLEKLSGNQRLLTDLRIKLQNGLPCIAECGGFMALLDTVRDMNGVAYPMAGVIQGEAFMTSRIGRFGYITLTAKQDNLLCRKGETLRAHEFHYSDSTNNGSDFTAEKPGGGRSWECVFADNSRFFGYPHIHLCGNPEYAENFLRACQRKEKPC